MLPLGLFFPCSAVSWRCDVRGKRSFAVFQRTLIRLVGRSGLTPQRSALAPKGSCVAWLAGSSSCRVCLVHSEVVACLWLLQILVSSVPRVWNVPCLTTVLPVEAHCLTGEKVCMLVWQIGTGPHAPCVESRQVCLSASPYAPLLCPSKNMRRQHGVATTQCASVVGTA